MITFKKTIYALLIALFVVVSTNFGMENNEKKNVSVSVKKTDLELFLEKFAPPKELRDLIEKHKKDINFTYILKGKTTSWICKRYYDELKDVTRIINASRCKNFIEKYKLDCLGVPLKYAYNIDGNIWVFAELVNPVTLKKEQQLTNEQVRQLAFFAYKTCFIDFGAYKSYGIFSGHNIIEQCNKLILIDTEDKSFDRNWADRDSISSRIGADDKLKKWLIKYDDLQRQNKIISTRCSIADNTEYDDPGIDFEKVKKEVKEKKYIQIMSQLQSKL